MLTIYITMVYDYCVRVVTGAYDFVMQTVNKIIDNTFWVLNFLRTDEVAVRLRLKSFYYNYMIKAIDFELHR